MVRKSLRLLNTGIMSAFLIMSCLIIGGCAPVSLTSFGLGGQPGADQNVYSAKPIVRVTDLERRIHELINLERTKHGLLPTVWNPRLNVIARRHSQDMAKRSYFSHYSPEGHDVAYRYAEQGFVCELDVGAMVYTGAENIYQNNLYDTIEYINGIPSSYHWIDVETIAQTTVAGWMSSSGHRRIILEPAWKTEGIGVAITNDYQVFITQDFC
jgi:uncharacterized protein YkwD